MHILYSYRSGTEEEYDELYQLLEDIFEFQRDMDEKKAQEKEEKRDRRNKELEDKKKGEDIREAALKGMISKFESFKMLKGQTA